MLILYAVMKIQPFRPGVVALTLPEILLIAAMTALLACLLLAAVQGRVRERSYRIQDTTNLKNIGLALRIFATDHNDQFPMRSHRKADGTLIVHQPDQIWRYWASLLSNELSTPKLLVSPLPDAPARIRATTFAEAATTTGQIPFNTNRNLSYFLGLDADETRLQSLLAGGRWITNRARPTIDMPAIVEMGRSENGPAGIASVKGSIPPVNVVLGEGSVQGLNVTRFNQEMQGSQSQRLALPD